MNRFVIIVLDSLGVGAAPDADRYRCPEANTLGHVAAYMDLSLPNLAALGLGNILPLRNVPPTDVPRAAWGRMQPAAAGMDTTSGHWELAGTPLPAPLPTFPQGFPEEILGPFRARTGRDVLCNRAGSGVTFIQEYGQEQVESGKLIVYTSADSVFQIAAHEDVVPPEQLYEYCRIARELLQGPYAVGRVIARPFDGDPQRGYTRTENRRDFSLAPLPGNLLERCRDKHIPVIAIGKIYDIFAGQHIDLALPGHNNQQSLDSLLFALKEQEQGLIFANFVDFDMLYGHRNDPAGYGQALEAFDRALPQVLALLRPGDILAVTGDHGNDPTTPSTDHSREYVPLLVTGPWVPGVELGTRKTFADLGQTAADFFGARPLPAGTSFLPELMEEV